MELEVKYRKPLEKRWLVVYARPRWEKKVDQLLKEQGIESFCPLRITENQWADRKKMISTPLFNGYLFVKIDDRDLSKVRYTLGVLNFIYFMGKPAVIREIEINQLKEMIKTYNSLEMIDLGQLSAGDRVRIRSGAFHDQEGKVIQVQGKTVLMAFDHLDCAIVTRVAINQLLSALPQNLSACAR